MSKEQINFDRLPQAITYLTEQVAELKQLVAELQPPQPESHRLVEIDDACRITKKAKPTIYALARKGLIPSYKRGKKLYFYEDELLTWIEQGRKGSPLQSYDEILASIQSGVRHKPKSGFKL